MLLPDESAPESSTLCKVTRVILQCKASPANTTVSLRLSYTGLYPQTHGRAISNVNSTGRAISNVNTKTLTSLDVPVKDGLPANAIMLLPGDPGSADLVPAMVQEDDPSAA